MDIWITAELEAKKLELLAITANFSALKGSDEVGVGERGPEWKEDKDHHTLM